MFILKFLILFNKSPYPKLTNEKQSNLSSSHKENLSKQENISTQNIQRIHYKSVRKSQTNQVKIYRGYLQETHKRRNLNG